MYSFIDKHDGLRSVQAKVTDTSPFYAAKGLYDIKLTFHCDSKICKLVKTLANVCVFVGFLALENS